MKVKKVNSCYCKKDLECFFNTEKTEFYKFECGKIYTYIESENSIWVNFDRRVFEYYIGRRFSIKNSHWYPFHSFSDYFAIGKELRKLKLNKINEKIGI